VEIEGLIGGSTEIGRKRRELVSHEERHSSQPSVWQGKDQAATDGSVPGGKAKCATTCRIVIRGATR